MQRTGLTMQTMSNICHRLLDAELIREAGRRQSGRGAPRIVYEVEPAGRYAVGVHIDPARLTLAVLDLAGVLRAECTMEIPNPPEPETILAAIDDGVSMLLSEHGLSIDRVVGIGVASPGPIDGAHGSVVGPPLLPGWDLVPLREALESRWGTPILVDKDNTAAAVGETWSAPRCEENFAFLYLGSGVAAGIVRNGEVIRGGGANIGNIAHLSADPDGPRCSCGGRGCVDVSAAPAVIVSSGIAAGALDPVDVTDAHRVEAALRDLARMADSDPQSSAAQVLDHAAAGYARVAVQLANLLDLEAIVLGGPQWPALEPTMLRVLPALLNEAYIGRAIHGIEVRGTAVGGPVAAIGAAALVMGETVFDAQSQLYLR